jgi:alkanesulfonate monooxygenase SsuD/methylene tetrahydromethanopterin reductase-like flavin-dependent oxidoreductase (luciferase family)
MVNVGVVVPSPLPAGMALPDIASLARDAETAALDCIWVEDNVGRGDAAVLDNMCVLAACAASTQRIEIGSAVFVPSLRNLFWALKQVATVQLLADGRLQLGVALGAASEEEYGLVGLTLRGQRQRTDEFLRVLTSARLGNEDDLGVGLSAAALLLGSEVPVPPLWVGGTSLAALRRAARFGDGWLSGAQTPAEFKASLRQLGQAAEEEGRPCPAAGAVLSVAVGAGPGPDLVAKCAADMQFAYGIPRERAEELAIAGTAQQVAESLARYVDAGAQRLALISHVQPWSESWPALGEVRRALLGR